MTARVTECCQAVAKVRSTFLNGVADLRYEKYCSGKAVQLAKETIATLNAAQSDAIKKVLKAHGVDAPLDELIDPILNATSCMMSKTAEDTARQKEYVYAVKPVRRPLGKVETQVKV